ncbi:MAG: nucleotide exchange factor GrpE [Gammaproteobacteria bacterium]|nr:nucleotide exchange factor GrpE [Gammaproteobacteria bacterium]
MASEENGSPDVEELDPNQDQTVEGEAVPPLDDIDSLKAKVAELEEQIEEQKETVLRAKAEEQNIKRRADNDVSNARKFALERFTNDLLPVIDSLERGLEITVDADNEQIKAQQEGVTLTLKMFEDVLNSNNILVVSPVGEPFDPALHQAMSMQESGDCEPNTVLAVMQKGYTLSGRLVRPAMVVVSKSPA